jgi:glycerophosphoryl diester phosphodiesterase
VLECDLQLTADRQLVCMHDDTVDRTTGGTATGAVDSFTLAQLREMDFGSWKGPEFAGAEVVTLEEQIACYRAVDPTIRYYIETKTQSDDANVMEAQLVDTLKRLDVTPEFEADLRSSPIIIQSFDLESLETVHDLAPELPTAYLVGVPTDELAAGQFPDVDVLAPSAAVIAAQPDIVDAAHAAGLEVHTWTVDDPVEMASLVAAGVDGFFTNTPSTGRAVVDQAGRGSGRRPAPDAAVDPSTPSEVPSCGAGLGVGMQPADLGQTSNGTTDETVVPGDANDSVAGWLIVVAVAVVAAAGYVVVRLRVRSRREP